MCVRCGLTLSMVCVLPLVCTYMHYCVRICTIVYVYALLCTYMHYCVYGSCIAYSVCIVVDSYLTLTVSTIYGFVDRSSCIMYILQAHNCVCNHYS